jgi:hypothetical protein
MTMRCSSPTCIATNRVSLRTPGLHVPERRPGRGRRTAELQAARKPVAVEAFVKGPAPQAWTRCNLRDSRGSALRNPHVGG